MRRAYFYSLLALCLLFMSLLLPALEAKVLGASATFSGWFTVLFGLRGAWESMQSWLGGGDKASWKFLLAAFGAGFNLTFFVAPFVLRNVESSRLRLIVTGTCSGTGFLLGVLVYLAFADMKIVPQPGYYLWLLAYVVNVYAVSLAVYESLRGD